MTIEIDFKTVFSALGFIISLVSLRMALLARKEARETALLELVHQKRMLLSNQLSDVGRVVRLLKDENFQTEDMKATYDRLQDYRNRMIDEINDSCEMLVDIDRLNKKTLLNQISDFNLLNAVRRADLADLQAYIEEKVNP